MINYTKSELSRQNYDLSADKNKKVTNTIQNTGFKAFNTPQLASQPHADTFTRSTKTQPSFGKIYNDKQVRGFIKIANRTGTLPQIRPVIDRLLGTTDVGDANDAIKILNAIPTGVRSSRYYTKLKTAFNIIADSLNPNGDATNKKLYERSATEADLQAKELRQLEAEQRNYNRRQLTTTY